MGEIIHEAGWPIYPVLAVGGTVLLLSVRHALVPDKNNARLIAGLAVLTLLCGALGTVLGLQHAISGLTDGAPERQWLVWVGLRESLNNVSMALVLVIFAGVFAIVGTARLGMRAPDRP